MTSAWPKPETVAAAIGGRVAEVVLWHGITYRGLRSAIPTIAMVTGNGKTFALCDGCKGSQGCPEVPGSGPAEGPRAPLLAAGTKAHAVFVLTWLHRFFAAHKDCAPTFPPKEELNK